jgi:hypothetical protein
MRADYSPAELVAGRAADYGQARDVFCKHLHDATTKAFGDLFRRAPDVGLDGGAVGVFRPLQSRLTASVDVGANGGVLYVPPTSPPPSSDAALVTTYAYAYDTTLHPNGLTVTAIDPRGIATQTTDDMLGRTTQTVVDLTDGQVTTSSNATTRYTYDGLDHTLTVTAVTPAGAPTHSRASTPPAPS